MPGAIRGVSPRSESRLPPTLPGNQAPVAVAYADTPSGSAALTVNFTGSESSDADGDILTYHWDFGDRKSSTEANPTHTFKKSGDYLVVLTVTDGDLTASATVDIHVDPRN